MVSSSSANRATMTWWSWQGSLKPGGERTKSHWSSARSHCLVLLSANGVPPSSSAHRLGNQRDTFFLFFPLLYFYIFIYLFLYAHACFCMCATWMQCLQRPEGGVGSLRTEVTSGCGTPNVGIGNQVSPLRANTLNQRAIFPAPWTV